MTDFQYRTVLLTTAYFPPVQYFSKVVSYKSVYIEAHENYGKQSFRNRCQILGANGTLDLNIPVKKEVTLKTNIRDIRIDYSAPWRKIHMRAVESAYRSSPFYLYYIDDIVSVLEKNTEFLFDLNTELLHLIIKSIGLNIQVCFTEDFRKVPFEFDDFSNSIHPKNRMKKPDKHFIEKSYYQVFNKKFGFVPNLSILDLLFNEGPNTHNILIQSLKSES